MNHRQKEVQQAQLDAERKALRELKRVYGQAQDDVVNKIIDLSRRQDMENLQSIVWQKQYQEALKKQIDGALEKLDSDSFTTVADFLGESYENGFMGTLYDLQGQGIPLCFPVDQTQVAAALQTDSKISQGLYARMGEDTRRLKNSIRAELSRGAANGESWLQIAGHIANGMTSPFDKAYRRTATIARTEGHRIQQQAALNCMERAKSKGADVVKQWDSTLDSLTRPDHVEANGQVAEINEPFHVGGEDLMCPGDKAGSPANVINCRCVMLQRARWAISDDEYYTKWDGDRDELVRIPAESFNEFKDKAKQTISVQTANKRAQVLVDKLQEMGVEYNAVSARNEVLTNEEIIKVLSGGDMTNGSCASVGLAYVGQQSGLDVRDFRGGKSREFYCKYLNLKEIAQLPGVQTTIETARSDVTVGNKLLKSVEPGKEYYLCVGKHAAIVQRTDKGVLQYLELQSQTRSGWVDFDGNPRYTLHTRFGCNQTGVDAEGFMIDVNSLKDSDDFKTLLGFINTAESEQRKGSVGGIK